MSSKVPGVRPAFLARAIPMYHTVRGTYAAHVYDLSKRYGRIFRLGSKSIAVADPEFVELIQSSPNFLKSHLYRTFQFHRDNIFSTRQKRIIGPVFSLSSVAELEPFIYRAGVACLVDRVAQYASTGETFDIHELFHYATFDIIGEVAFGGSFNTLKGKPGDKPHPVIDWFRDMTYLSLLKEAFGAFYFPWLFSKYVKSEQSLVEFTRSVIKKRIETNIKNEDDQQAMDVLQRMIDSKDPETGEKLDIDQIIAESIVQLLAGMDTSALTMTWTLYFLTEHPDAYRRLKKEIDAACPGPDQPLKHADVKNLTYLNAVLMESMRLRPMPSGTQRLFPPGGAVVCGIYFPEGFTISPALWAIHKNPNVYGDNADEFYPERWLIDDQVKLKQMRKQFLGFGVGTRTCIGQNLAWMELRLLLASILRQFDFTIPADVTNDMTPLSLFTLKPRGNCFQVRATPCSR
ncbi:cytochrome P450 [Syncephalis fuscata]|nr:cytochrome P450 [Syncephalis fuscata]